MRNQTGGFLGAIARFLPKLFPLVKTVASKLVPALATGAVTGLAEQGVKTLMGAGVINIPKNKVPILLSPPYVDHLTQSQIKGLQEGRGLRITKKQQTGGFLGMLASLGIPLIASLFGKGLQIDSTKRQYKMLPKRYGTGKKKGSGRP